jgi:serine O-acetyltransferase
MIKNKKDYLRYIKNEETKMRRSYPTFTRELELILKYIKLYRKAEYYYNCKPHSLRGKIIIRKWQRKSFEYGFHLPLNVIDEGLCIIHIGPIYINEFVKIGKDLRIHPMTTIGKSIGREESCPVIGDGVWIGPGARIYGAIVIGNNSVIGCNAVVNKDVKENMTVAGIPAKIINNKGYLDYFQKN